MARDICFGFTCTCGAPDLEADIVVDYAGHPGTAPSLWYPGDPPEGAEWHVATPVVCTDDPGLNGGEPIKGCGKIWDSEDLAEKFEDEIQQRIAERDYDEGY